MGGLLFEIDSLPMNMLYTMVDGDMGVLCWLSKLSVMQSMIVEVASYINDRQASGCEGIFDCCLWACGRAFCRLVPCSSINYNICSSDLMCMLAHGLVLDP